MGLALAAELNGYPGPAHVLDRSAGSLMNAGARGADHALGWPSKSRQRLPELCPSIRLLFNYKLCDASSGARGFLFDGNLIPRADLIVPIDNLWRPMSITV
jgi:hypothetical protein